MKKSLAEVQERAENREGEEEKPFEQQPNGGLATAQKKESPFLVTAEVEGETNQRQSSPKGWPGRGSQGRGHTTADQPPPDGQVTVMDTHRALLQGTETAGRPHAQ